MQHCKILQKRPDLMRLWGYEKFSEIADHLYQMYYMSIFITGSKEELTRCDRLIKEECLKNISVYEVIDKIDNELTNIYYENS